MSWGQGGGLEEEEDALDGWSLLGQLVHLLDGISWLILRCFGAFIFSLVHSIPVIYYLFNLAKSN